MFTVSANFSDWIKDKERDVEVRVVVGPAYGEVGATTTYLDDVVVDFEVIDSVVPDDELVIGSVIPSKLRLSLKTSDTIPTNASLTPSVRLSVGGVFTEWVPLGTFYVDNRSYFNEVWVLEAYNTLMITEQVFDSLLTYPETMVDVLDEIRTILDLTLDSSVVIDPAYMIPYKLEGITIREMLSHIFSAHGACCIMTKDNKLGMVKFGVGDTTSIGANQYFDFKESNPLKTITRIVAIYNQAGEFLVVGSGDEKNTLTFYNPFITETILDGVLTLLNGYTYQPFDMMWRNFVYLDVGDTLVVTARDLSVNTSPMLHNTTTYKGGLLAKSSAPSKSELESEFNYSGSLKSYIVSVDKTSLKEFEPYFGVVIGRTNGLVITKSDNSAEAILNSDELKFTAGGVDKLYFDPISGEYRFVGKILVSGDNTETIIDEYGINPKFLDYSKNLIWNSSFEVFDADLKPLFWFISGVGFCSQASTFYSDRSLKLEPNALARQTWAARVKPVWIDGEEVRVSMYVNFVQDIEVRVVDIGTWEETGGIVVPYYGLWDGTLPKPDPLPTTLTFTGSDGWEDSRITFSFDSSEHGIGSTVAFGLEIKNVGTGDVYIDGVMAHVDFTGQWAQLYKDGPRSTSIQAVGNFYTNPDPLAPEEAIFLDGVPLTELKLYDDGMILTLLDGTVTEYDFTLDGDDNITSLTNGTTGIVTVIDDVGGAKP